MGIWPSTERAAMSDAEDVELLARDDLLEQPLPGNELGEDALLDNPPPSHGKTCGYLLLSPVLVVFVMLTAILASMVIVGLAYDGVIAAGSFVVAGTVLMAGQALGSLYVGARFLAASRGMVLGDLLDSLRGRVFWAIVCGAALCSTLMATSAGQLLPGGIMGLLLSCLVAAVVVGSARGRPLLVWGLAGLTGLTAVLTGIQLLLIGLRADQHLSSSWALVLLPLWLPPLLVVLSVASWVWMSRSAGCGPLWDCARAEPAEGVATGVLVAVVLVSMTPLIMTANLLLPLLNGQTDQRPYSLCLLPVELFLLLCILGLCLRVLRTLFCRKPTRAAPAADQAAPVDQ